MVGLHRGNLIIFLRGLNQRGWPNLFITRIATEGVGGPFNKTELNMNITDLTKLTWALNVALIGAVFSIFSLIYNPYFIYYGFLTVLYGILCHIVSNSYDFWLKKEGWTPKIVFILQFMLTGLWVTFQYWFILGKKLAPSYVRIKGLVFCWNKISLTRRLQLICYGDKKRNFLGIYSRNKR